MKPKLLAVVILLTMIACNTISSGTYEWPDNIEPPIAVKKPHQRMLHGDTVTDNYFWMIDYFKKGPDSTHVVQYLEAENAYLDTMMSAARPFREKLFTEMKGRIREKDESVPVFKNGYYYYNRLEEGKQYFKYCRKKGSLDAPEELLLDVDELSQGHNYYAATGFNISEDNQLLAFGVDTVGRRQYTIYIKNLATGQLYSDAMQPTTGGSAWAADNKTLFYTQNNPATLLTEQIKRHRLGTPAAEDAIVYYEKDNSNYIGVSKTKSGRFILIESSATMSSEYRFVDAAKPEEPFKVFQPRMKDVLYEISDEGNHFLIVTNWNARNFRLMECAYNQTDSIHWKELIPNRADVLLEGIEGFKDYLVIVERKNGLHQLRVRRLDNGEEHYLDFGEPAYAANPGANPEFSSVTLRYNYTSLSTPNSTYDYNMNTHEKKLMKQQEVVGGYNPADYTSERLYATAKDGTKIPISLVYKNEFKKNGEAPVLLYGYGSYGNSMDASFSSARLSLLNRGFVFAIAHIRGGQEMGRQWYEGGKMMNKKNTFTDFISCGEYLIGQQYTSRTHLYAQGGSAGGLLMGAITNMRPDLWHGVIAQVPFVDVVNTMLDESIPLTTNEFDEWGNPKNKDAYEYMKSYSPYENVQRQVYPNLLVTTGLHDSQVQYFEPAKWVAKMRDLKMGRNQLLLYTNMAAGHGGASGRFNYLKEVALEYAFLCALEGINE